jgi:plastocyanin
VVPRPVAAASLTVTVRVEYQAFAPGQVDALPGDGITWRNVSDRDHTVTADDGSFDSGVLTAGDSFAQTFAEAGVHRYHCTLHATMTGEIDVSPVLLDALPTAAIPAGDPVEFSGRTADPAQAVTIERAAEGTSDYAPVATATPSADGTWSTSMPARASGDYRATDSAGSSQPRRLLVSDRKVLLHVSRRGVSVTVTPPLPYGRVLLQAHLREHFGWWPQARRRLDYVSRAFFALRRGERVRVELVGRDRWTPLATSAALRFTPR